MAGTANPSLALSAINEPVIIVGANLYNMIFMYKAEVTCNRNTHITLYMKKTSSENPEKKLKIIYLYYLYFMYWEFNLS